MGADDVTENTLSQRTTLRIQGAVPGVDFNLGCLDRVCQFRIRLGQLLLRHPRRAQLLLGDRVLNDGLQQRAGIRNGRALPTTLDNFLSHFSKAVSDFLVRDRDAEEEEEEEEERSC